MTRLVRSRGEEADDDRFGFGAGEAAEVRLLGAKLEDERSKRWILKNYLNDVPYGTLGGRTAMLADLSNLPYTEMVVRESMRLYPPAYSFGRMAIEDVEIAGYDIPANSDISIFNITAQRDPRWWDEPMAFRPERFSPENEKNIARYAYLPFGGGPRICIGNHFSLMEAQILLAMISSRYQLTHAPDTKVIPLRQVTTFPKDGMPMMVHERETFGQL